MPFIKYHTRLICSSCPIDETLVTRDCLSNLIGLRSDIPADTFEGCRQAAKSKIAIYVDNNIKELDLKRDYYDKVDYCFCGLDNWCNSGLTVKSSFVLLCLACLVTRLLLIDF